jgi:intracellular multiplication protein IcmE
MKKLNTKTRTLIILIVAVLLIGLGITYFIKGKAKSTEQLETKASSIPTISTIPGGVTSEKYQNLQEQENKKKIEEAKKQGVSSVATIIGNKKTSNELFGIEDQLKQCAPCPNVPKVNAIPELDESLIDRLIKEIEANPDQALRILRENPGLARAIAKRNPALALQLMERDPEIAKIFLREAPNMARPFAEKNPAMFKKIVLSDPFLASLLAKDDPALFIKLIMDDPDFAKALTETNPDLVKELLKNDPDFAAAFAKKYPELMKLLMRKDPVFANIMGKNNPAMVKTLILSDPEFAKQIARSNPEMIKELMKNDPEFAKTLALQNPTLVKELMKNDPAFARLMAAQNPDMVKALMADDPEFARLMARTLEAGASTAGLSPDQARIQALEETRRKQAEEQKLLARDSQTNELQQQQLAAILTNMENQSKTMFQSWNEITPQQMIEGDWAKDEKDGDTKGKKIIKVEKVGPNAAVAVVAAAPVLIKAGTVLFAILETAVNSDEPGPVLATIVGGPLKGARLVGNMTITPPPPGASSEAVTLTFNTLSLPSKPNSISVNAVAVDTETARTAIADDVDHHYLLRYGSLFASSFMAGYAKVITSQGTVQTSSANGLQTTTQSPMLSNRQTVLAALGEVGKKWGEAISGYFNRPNTITVDSGTGIGLLFLADVQG